MEKCGGDTVSLLLVISSHSQSWRSNEGRGGLSLDLGLPGENLHKWLAQKWKHRHSFVSPNRLGCTFRLKNRILCYGFHNREVIQT